MKCSGTYRFPIGLYNLYKPIGLYRSQKHTHQTNKVLNNDEYDFSADSAHFIRMYRAQVMFKMYSQRKYCTQE